MPDPRRPRPVARMTLLGVLALLLLGAPRIARGDDGTPAEALAGMQAASARARIEAAWALAEVRTPAARAAWVAALGDAARPELHFEAAARLGAFEPRGADARAALEAARTAGEPAVRLAASVALGRTEPPQGAVDSLRHARPGAAFFGPLPAHPPGADGPTRFDVAALDGTLWLATSPINILGEGTLTYVTLRRGGDGLVALVARAAHRVVRPPHGPAPTRRWATTWSLATGWIDVARGRWQGGHTASSVVALPPGRGTVVGVGLVQGRLVAPALVRRADGRWKHAGAQDELTLELPTTLVPGRHGVAALAIRPPVGPVLAGRVAWRVEAGEDGVRLELDEAMPIEGGRRRIRPHSFLLDVGTGCAQALGSVRHASTVYRFVKRLGSPAKPN